MNSQPNDSFLVIGLGNPGKKYIQTRHNVGFRVVDSVFQKTQQADKTRKFSDFKTSKKHSCLLAKTSWEENQLILAKPQTFMNRSGHSVQSICSFFKIPLKKIIVIHDDIDLDFGVIRLSHDSGPAGHNGVKSIIESFGSKQFIRLRIGVGKQKEDSFVLKDFSKTQNQELVSNIIPRATEATLDLIEKDFEKAACKHNGPEKN